MPRFPSLAALALAACAALSACGGGGGGGGSTGSGPPPTTVPTVTATPVVTPSPTPTPVAPQYTGRVVDSDHGAAGVPGATVTVGTSFAYASSGYAIAGVLATATTAPDGSFTVPAPSGALYVQVTKTGLVDLHRPLPSAGSTTLGTLALPTANADELSGLAELNVNRAKYGSGAGAQPITLDADAMLAARAHALDEGTQGYYDHIAPGTLYLFSSHYFCVTNAGAFCANPLFIQENLDEFPGPSGNLTLANDAYIAKGANDGHFQNVVSKTDLWVGLGSAYSGKPDPNSTVNGTESYFVENYITSTANPSP
jgi:uncharacterized protein YkwD